MNVVNLKRLIERTERFVEEKHKAEEENESYKAKLECAVLKMDEMLKDIEKSDSCSTKEQAKLQRMVERFQDIVKTFQDGTEASVPSFKLTIHGSELSRKQKSVYVDARAHEMSKKRRNNKESLMRLRWDDFEASAKERRAVEDESDTEKLLAYHEQEQERIAEEMVAGSLFMKHSALAIEETLKMDEGRMKDLNDVQATNFAGLQKEKGRIKKQAGRTCGMTIATIVMCIIVTITFFWTVLFMRMTRK